MGLLKQKEANGTTPAPAAPAAEGKKTEEAKPPATPPAGSIYAKDGKEGESYKVGERMGVFQACAGARVFFVAADGAPFTCTATDMITPASNAAPAGAPAFGSLGFEQLKIGESYVVDAKGTIAEFTGTVAKTGVGFFAVGEAMVKLPAGSKVDPCKVTPDNKVLPKDAPASAPPGAVAPVTKGGDDAEDDEPESEDDSPAPPTDTKAAETPAPATPAAEPAKGKGRSKKSDPTDADLGKAAAPAGLILVVGATPTKGGTDLAKYVDDMARTLAAKEKLVDVRCAPKDSALAYDGWKALMRACAIKSPPTGLCFVYPGGLNDPVIEGLATVADCVIRF